MHSFTNHASYCFLLRPNDVFEELKKILMLHIWRGSSDNIKKKTIIGGIEEWDIKMTDIRSFAKALKISLIYGEKTEMLIYGNSIEFSL